MRTRLATIWMAPGPVRRAFDGIVGGFVLALMREPLASRLAWFGRRRMTVPSARAVNASPWSQQEPDVPTTLLTTPGSAIDDAACSRAAHDRPLRAFWTTNPPWEGWTNRAWWRIFIRVLPGYLAGKYAVADGAVPSCRHATRATDPTVVTDMIRAEGRRLGFSAVGFAAYDARWTFDAEGTGHPGRSVIIGIMEEDYASEQSAPSAAHERRAVLLLGEQMVCTSQLARFIRNLGYDAVPHDADGPFLFIPYAVASGLGQLGLNGQLLTPVAGARCTLTAMTTRAPVVHGTPVDYGITAICDACQACARRCPVGAIPVRRQQHRGVTKAKIKTERCLPIVAQTDGCAVCSKVCPIQRYGLTSVLNHYRETGQIKGRDTDELEGFRWPLDARFYGAGYKPRIDSEQLLHPPALRSCPAPTTS